MYALYCMLCLDTGTLRQTKPCRLALCRKYYIRLVEDTLSAREVPSIILVLLVLVGIVDGFLVGFEPWGLVLLVLFGCEYFFDRVVLNIGFFVDFAVDLVVVFEDTLDTGFDEGEVLNDECDIRWDNTTGSGLSYQPQLS
jgi:hypothetical protein